MANRNEIIDRITRLTQSGQDIVRRECLGELAAYTGRDTILYAVPFNLAMPGIPSNVTSVTLDDVPGFMTCLNGLSGNSLDLILHSPGGSLEAAEQLVQYLRAKYGHIRAIVPQNAMSAATMIACACDEIILGKQSAIGPIDPQIALPRQGGVAVPVPAHSILADFEKAKKEIANDKNAAVVWMPKIMELPHGILDLCQETIDLAKSKVADWINDYMYKGQSNAPGQVIANWLGNFTEHKTHGRPINYTLAQNKGLKVRLLEDDQVLQDWVLSVYHATLATFEITPYIKIIENHNGQGAYTAIQART